MGTSVLLVDDHEGFRHQARLLLEEAGFEVVAEAGGAFDAVAAARRLCPELVLLDVQLPDGNGFDVAAVLTGEPDGPAVVLVSGRELTDYRARVETCGARGFIAKADLSPEVLMGVLSGGSG